MAKRILSTRSLADKVDIGVKPTWDSIAGTEVNYEPVGPIVYMGSDRHIARVRALLARKPAKLVLSFASTTRIDLDGANAMGKLIQSAKEAGVPVEVVVSESLAEHVLARSAWFVGLRAEGRVRSSSETNVAIADMVVC